MSKTVFAFGRMNPPTIGHEKLADKVASEAKRRGAMPHIYLSHTQNAKKDPLPYSVKIAIAKKAFGKAVTRSSAKSIIQVMQELEKMGHKEVVLIAGSDRVPEFKTFLAKYNGKDYNFDKIEVVSAGERDPDAEGVAGMSASKLRAIAKEGDYDTFAKGMPSKLRDADKKKVYNTIRSVMEDYGNIDESALSALRVATAAHRGQKRKSGDDYISHPKEVARIVKQYKKSHNLDALIQAAYLHDTIEDTDTTYKDLVKQFGGLVAGMVKDLTSDKEAIEAMGKGEYIADKMAKMSSWSLVIKLADRLANVGDIDDRPANFQKKYANQTKLALDRLKKDRYLSKTHKKIMAAINDKIKEYVTESINESPRIPRKKGQPAGSDKHSDLYTDENPKGTIHGLKFATEKDAEASVAKIKSSGKKHAHKIQAAIAMEQRARVAGKTAAASVYRAYINDMKKKTKEMNEAFQLRLERDKRAKLLVLHVKDTKTGNRSEVRGKPGYEVDGYDPKDKLHKLLDKIGKSANMSELMNGEKVTINPNHPDGKEAVKVAKEITSEMYEEVTAKQISDLEKFGDRLLDKFGIDIEFSKHFADRMNDDRNNPEIKVAEIQALFKKIARKKAVNIKKYKDSEVVLKDIQKDLNLPVAIKTGKDGELDVVHKTIMRKKNFKTPNPIVQYEETQLDEGVNDPAIFKAVFLAGGPGSGKSFIVGKTGLVNIGMKLVNSDDEFERRLKNAGLDAGNPDDIYSPQGQALRGKAKKTTANKQDMYIKGRLGLVLDGTGKDYDKIKKVRDQLIRLGYDTAMIFVNTNLETSLERNRKRARSLPDAEVEKMWKGVQDNMGKFQKLFGNDFTIVDNSEGADTPGATTSAYKKMVKFAKQSPKSRAAKNWIANEKSRRGIKEDYDPTDEELDDILNEIEDDDLFWEWDEDDDFELGLDEAPLTMQQRMKRRLLMKRLAPRIARKRALKMKKRAGKDQLVKRSRRAALLLVKKKVAGDKGKNYKELSPSEKIGIDRLVQKRLPMVGKIAKRLLPKMTKKETERMRNRSKTNESFELFIEQKVAQDPDVDERPGTQPKKYYSGVRKKSKEARAKHFERGSKMDDDNPAAYTPAPGDSEGKTKPSKHTKKFKQMFGEKVEYLEEKQIDALKKKSEKTGIPYGILKQVYNRGMAAWRTGHRPGTTPQQWAFARVNSFATKSKGTWGGADKDLAAKARGSMKKEQVTEADPCWDGFKQVGMKKGAGGKMVPNCVPEEVELEEGKSSTGYELYHKDFSSAMQHAYDFAKKKFGIEVDPKEIDDKVASGPRKPSKGKTNSYRLKGKDGKKAIQVQVYGMDNGKYELNMYKEEVEIDEGKVKFVKDKEFPNLRKPKGTTDYEFKKFLMKTKSRQKDYFRGEDNIKEREMTDGEKEKLDRLKKKYEKSDMQKSMKDRYGDDGPFYATLTKMAMNKEAVSPAQQAAIAIAKKKSGKYDDEGKKIDEEDAAAIAKERHNDEKERLKRKHDRELDAARLRDTRTKNANEAFEALIEEPCCDDCAEDEYGWAEETDFIAIDESAAEYQGRKVKLNNPTRSDNPKKKTMVYVKNEKGNVVKVYFGDPNMSIKRDDPERRKNFRARHNCDNPGPKWKARYWSCKFWSKKPVSKLMKG